MLRVRGIKDEPFSFRAGEDSRVAFPHKILETNLVERSWNFIFVEHAVTQRISFSTLIPDDYTYVLAHLMFEYKKYWPHTADAIRAVPARSR